MPDLSVYYALQAVFSHWRAFRQRRRAADLHDNEDQETALIKLYPTQGGNSSATS